MVRVVGSTGVKSAVAACAAALVTATEAETGVFAVVLLSAVFEVVPVSALPVSALPVADGPGGGASGCELAAIAAAAMASGAVGPPEVGADAGTLVAGADVGTATATGVGVAVPTCCARMVASTAVESALVCESLDL